MEARQGGVDAAHARVAEVAARKDALLREAKASLGLWSGESSPWQLCVADGGKRRLPTPAGLPAWAAACADQLGPLAALVPRPVRRCAEAGVAEGRELFWESYAAGKLFAQRRTFWDSLWIILGSRERDWLSMLLNLLFQVGGPWLCVAAGGRRAAVQQLRQSAAPARR